MQGKISNINYRTGLAAIKVSEDCFSIFEMMGTMMEVGQEVSGDLESKGTVTVKNLTRNLDMEIYILETRCNSLRATELLQWHINDSQC